MSANVKRRLAKLEAERIDAQAMPRYVSVSSADELQALELARPTKVYIGISPDDWSADNER